MAVRTSPLPSGISYAKKSSSASVLKSSVAEVDSVIPYLESLSEDFNISFTLLLSGEEAEASELTKKYIVK